MTGISPIYVLAASAVAVSHTGNTSLTNIATVTVPAGTMKANGFLRITTMWSFTNSGNDKNMRVRFDGTAFLNITLGALDVAQNLTIIRNRNSEASQVGYRPVLSNPHATSLGSLQTTTIDTSVAKDITFDVQLAEASETITLESYIVEVCPRHS